MTDNLRDRVVAVLQSADRRMALEDEMPIEVYYASLADAVIDELGLQDCDIEDCRCRHRYVTELKRMEMGEWDVLAQGFRGFRYVTPWDVDDE